MFIKVEHFANDTNKKISGDLTGVGGYVALDTRRQEIVASFRGSSNIRNFITDIRFNLASCSNIVKDCQVHDGFADGWSEISGKVFAAVKAASEANPGYKIVATGHSLGAAIATLGAAYLRQVGYDVDLYTYGSPRVGNDAFANFITQSRGGQWRVTHRDDPVPRLPPLFTGYRHISPEYWLKGGNTDQIEYPITSIMQCDGIANINCNAGTFGLNTEAHGYYFRKVGACSTTGGLQWKRSELDPTHKELELRLNVWSQKDQEMFKNY